MEEVKVGVIGAGGLANVMHYPSLASFPDVRIVGVCDLDAARREETADKFSVEARFADYREMLEAARPDAVYALMPPHHLFDVAMDVIEAGFPLFVEKPPSVTTDQARALGRRAEQMGVITAVGFQRRYHPLFRACFDKVNESGTVHQVVSTFYKCMPPADPSPYYRGAIDILRCDAIHAVDSLRFYSGLSPVKAVASEVRRLDCTFPVSFNSLVYFENGCVGLLLANWRSGRRILNMEFHAAGACGMAQIDGQGRVWKDDGAEPVLEGSYQDAGAEDYVNQGFLAENRAFIDAVKAGEPVLNSIADAAHTMALVDRIYHSTIA